MTHRFQSDLAGRDEGSLDDLKRLIFGQTSEAPPSFGGGAPSGAPSPQKVLEFIERTDLSDFSENQLNNLRSIVTSVGARIPEKLSSAIASTFEEDKDDEKSLGEILTDAAINILPKATDIIPTVIPRSGGRVSSIPELAIPRVGLPADPDAGGGGGGGVSSADIDAVLTGEGGGSVSGGGTSGGADITGAPLPPDFEEQVREEVERTRVRIDSDPQALEDERVFRGLPPDATIDDVLIQVEKDIRAGQDPLSEGEGTQINDINAGNIEVILTDEVIDDIGSGKIDEAVTVITQPTPTSTTEPVAPQAPTPITPTTPETPTTPVGPVTPVAPTAPLPTTPVGPTEPVLSVEPTGPISVGPTTPVTPGPGDGTVGGGVGTGEGTGTGEGEGGFDPSLLALVPFLSSQFPEIDLPPIETVGFGERSLGESFAPPELTSFEGLRDLRFTPDLNREGQPFLPDPFNIEDPVLQNILDEVVARTVASGAARGRFGAGDTGDEVIDRATQAILERGQTVSNIRSQLRNEDLLIGGQQFGEDISARRQDISERTTGFEQEFRRAEFQGDQQGQLRDQLFNELVQIQRFRESEADRQLRAQQTAEERKAAGLGNIVDILDQTGIFEGIENLFKGLFGGRK